MCNVRQSMIDDPDKEDPCSDAFTPTNLGAKYQACCGCCCNGTRRLYELEQSD